eukprot:UN10832
MIFDFTLLHHFLSEFLKKMEIFRFKSLFVTFFSK